MKPRGAVRFEGENGAGQFPGLELRVWKWRLEVKEAVESGTV